MDVSSEALTTILAALSALGSGVTWSAIGALAAAGTIAMAILQVIKELSPLREWFQKRWFESWIDSRFADFNTSIEITTSTVHGAVANPTNGNGEASQSNARRADATPTIAKKDVVELATGGLACALYGLPADDMAAQINLAAQITLDTPVRYKELLAVLSDGVSLEDLTTVMKGQPTSGSTQEYFDARARVGRRIQRNLDGVRIALGSRWKLWMQIASLALSTVVVELAVAANGNANFDSFLLALPIGIVGGYLAPISRDLVAALQQLRNPR